MCLATIEDIKKDQVVYYVHALGYSSFLTTYELTGDIITHEWDRLALFAEYVYESHLYKSKLLKSTFSLLDCNVIPNDYNEHRLFTCPIAAWVYLQKCKGLQKQEYHFTYTNSAGNIHTFKTNELDFAQGFEKRMKSLNWSYQLHY